MKARGLSLSEPDGEAVRIGERRGSAPWRVIRSHGDRHSLGLKARHLRIDVADREPDVERPWVCSVTLGFHIGLRERGSRADKVARLGGL